MTEHRLDVSALEPCEPLERILAAARSLPAGHYLRVLHRREPHPLFPLLRQLGCDWDCRAGTTTACQILVWRADDARARAAVEALLGD